MDKKLLSHVNWSLLACMLILFLVGVGNLWSASGTRMEDGVAFSDFYQRQLIWGACGLFCMLVVMCIDYHKLSNIAWILYAVSIVLLLLVPVAGKTVYGARRWLSLGFMSIQPSEMAKLAVLVLAARLLAKDSEYLGWKEFFKILGVCMVPAGLILIQPDLGTTLLLLLILALMILFHGVKSYVFKTCALLTPCVIAFMWFVGMHDYQRQRVLAFLDPGNDPRGSGYHILQSRIAIGSGEIWGKGFGEGTQSQLRFLPERHSDFAVAVFGEEWGFAGCVALVFVFSLFLLSIFSTAIHARDRFGSMLSVGVFFYFFWQIVINMGMVIGLMPVVGVPLPFISYGGSATIINFTLLGIVLSVSMRRYMFS